MTKDRIQELENLIDTLKYNGVHGSMVERFITCGKAGCKCKKGIKHGPYPHIQVYDNNNKLHGIYIGKKKKDKYSYNIENNKKFLSIIKELNKLYLLDRNIV